jgi:hypothetical protein
MTTVFKSVQEAKEWAAMGAGVDSETFQEIELLDDKTIKKSLKEHPNASKEEKDRFLANVKTYRENNKQFKAKNINGIEFNVIIGPFRDGFECFLCDEEGKGMRL